MTNPQSAIRNPQSQRSPELIRLERLGAALASLPRDGAAWRAIEEKILADTREARGFAHSPDLPEDKRSYWAGACYALEDLWEELQDLQSGAWKQWPNVAQMRKQQGEED